MKSKKKTTAIKKKTKRKTIEKNNQSCLISAFANKQQTRNLMKQKKQYSKTQDLKNR